MMDKLGHQDVFRVPDSTREIPRGTVKRINGRDYAWTGKKWKSLPEKRENPGLDEAEAEK